MNEMIERMKHNKVPFGLLEPEERECLEKVGKENCQYWDINWLSCAKSDFSPFLAYRIRPDYYQPD